MVSVARCPQAGQVSVEDNCIAQTLARKVADPSDKIMRQNKESSER
jgi:hypothetical protein